MGTKVPVGQIDYSSVPIVETLDELITMYQIIRDRRFLYTPDMPHFARRISWLYPDDGCFARAAMSTMRIDKKGYTAPGKIFVFGELMFSTPYSEEGIVTWWYHVAPVISYMGIIYVLDPAIDFKGPLLVNEWFRKMGNVNEFSGAVCNSNSYDPLDECNASKKQAKRAHRDQLRFLNREWDRVVQLGFNPTKVLGANPPW